MKRLLDYHSLKENKRNDCVEQDGISCSNCNGRLFNNKISCEEKGKTLQFSCNGYSFYKIKLDDNDRYSFLKDIKRCDFIIISEELTKIALWVELKKGGEEGINDALEQLGNSIIMFGRNIQNKYAAIVCSRFPKSGSSTTLYKEKCKKKYDTLLFIETRLLNLKYNPNDNTISKT
ncbi:MAG: hypothetical protein J6M43_04680 [Neisseriaceae bacterium]|nr:hypothetical protein [Neisseriaceae bacterium]